jgi:hypothetical protein
MSLHHCALAVVSLLLSEPWLPHDRPATPLRLPEPTKVDRIIVTGDSLPSNKLQLTLTDSKDIGKVLAFIRTRNDGWITPWYTFPGPRYTIEFEYKKTLVVVLWVGPTWIGGRQGEQGSSANRLRSLPEKDLTELLQFLGVGKR